MTNIDLVERLRDILSSVLQDALIVYCHHPGCEEYEFDLEGDHVGLTMEFCMVHCFGKFNCDDPFHPLCIHKSYCKEHASDNLIKVRYLYYCHDCYGE